jgi:hypothetical protein
MRPNGRDGSPKGTSDQFLTNSLPVSLRAYKDEKVDGIFDITKKIQLDEFVSETKRITERLLAD